MISHGSAPFLECSSKGDSRFSAFYARIRARGNKSIEDIYQAAKVFEDGSTGLGWREAKGKRATNMAEVTELYAILWNDFIAENPELGTVLLAATGLSDRFGQPGHCCQATELWRIRNGLLAAANNPDPEQDSIEIQERERTTRNDRTRKFLLMVGTLDDEQELEFWNSMFDDPVFCDRAIAIGTKVVHRKLNQGDLFGPTSNMSISGTTQTAIAGRRRP